MEKNKATTYTTAKKRIGCKEPSEVKFLVFIDRDLNCFSIGLNVDFADSLSSTTNVVLMR